MPTVVSFSEARLPLWNQVIPLILFVCLFSTAEYGNGMWNPWNCRSGVGIPIIGIWVLKSVESGLVKLVQWYDLSFKVSFYNSGLECDLELSCSIYLKLLGDPLCGPVRLFYIGLKHKHSFDLKEKCLSMYLLICLVLSPQLLSVCWLGFMHPFCWEGTKDNIFLRNGVKEWSEFSGM